MPDQTHIHRPVATVERRTDAIQAAFDERGLKATEFVDEFKHLAEEQWVPQNGARVVAKAWTDRPSASGCWPTVVTPSPNAASPCRRIGTWWCWRTRRRCTT